MSEERLTLVTDFGKLKAGDLVVAFCGHCGGRHRLMLIRRESITGLNSLEGYGTYPYWSVEPWSVHPGGQQFGISEQGVRKRLVYLVDTGLDRQETHEAAQGTPREASRAISDGRTDEQASERKLERVGR